MKAMVYYSYGNADELEHIDIPAPSPGPGEVLVQVAAAGVNPVDWKIRSGAIRLFMPVQFPVVPGAEFSGEVVALGEGVTGFEVGDCVFALIDPRKSGASAEYVCAPANALARKPDSLPHVQAASIPLAGLTALQALKDKAAVQEGERVLVIGASGGVGMFAVEIAKAMGARVTGVCSGKNVDTVLGFGADEVIAYDTETYDDRGPYDVIFDAVAARTFFQVRRFLSPNGRYISTLPSPGNIASWTLGPLLPAVFGGRKSFGSMVHPSGSELGYLAELSVEGQLATHVEKVYPLSHLGEAHLRSESGRVVGKLVVEVPHEQPSGKE